MVSQLVSMLLNQTQELIRPISVILACLVRGLLCKSKPVVKFNVPDDYSVFRKVYEAPIVKSRMPDATRKEVELGDGRTEQVSFDPSDSRRGLISL
jgi:hypothetical protein